MKLLLDSGSVMWGVRPFLAVGDEFQKFPLYFYGAGFLVVIFFLCLFAALAGGSGLR